MAARWELLLTLTLVYIAYSMCLFLHAFYRPFKPASITPESIKA